MENKLQLEKELKMLKEIDDLMSKKINIEYQISKLRYELAELRENKK